MQTAVSGSEGSISSAETKSHPINSDLEQTSSISPSTPEQQDTHSSNQAHPTTQVANKVALMNQGQSQTQTQQQQPKPAASPSQQQQGMAVSASAGSIANSVSGSGISSNNFVATQSSAEQANIQSSNSNTMYQRQRHGHYHNQHHPPHYHHQHHHSNSKYSSSKSDNESIVNHVILITVINPQYPITCDLIHQICSTYGKVNRIVIFKKNGVQAMVEYDNVESAKRAKLSLQNCDIYSGCCTLRVEYAKPARLNVHKNDNESFDYTNPNLDCGNSQPSDAEHTNGNPHHIHHQHGSSSHPTANVHGGSNHHHSRGSTAHRRVGGDAVTSSDNAGSGQHASQFHSPQQMHPDNQAMKQSTSATLTIHTGQQATAYVMGQPIDVPNTSSSEAIETFHQPDGGFNASRVGAGNGSNHQSSFVGNDSFMTPVHAGLHNIPGNSYQRQDGGHQHSHHQHHHHHRVGMSGSGGGSGSSHNHHSAAFQPVSATNPLMGGPTNLAPQGTVMMVYGLSPERINCDRLFNLFCLYGNVVRVKFLRSKEGCAMVQMGDVIAVDRCVSSLNKITLFGNELQIAYSKQAFLHDVVQPFMLPDGTPSFKDYNGNKNNRFRNPEVASKNRILPPSRVLHFFNAPYGINDDELIHLFKQATDHEPVSVKIFTPKAENVKSFSGLVTFGDTVESTEALVLCNHISMPKAGAPHPYILRLCFSPPTYC